MKIFKKVSLYFRENYKNPENIFAILSLSLGAIFVCFFPLLKTPDEYAHFTRVYSITEGKIIPDGIETAKVSKSVVDTKKIISKGRYSRKDLLAYRPKDSEIVDDWSSANTYNPIAYIPQVVTIMLLKVLNCPIVLMLYILRLVSLILWTVVVYFSIKIAPWRKWTIVGISIFPTMVLQSISPGADVVQIGFGILFLAIICRSISRNQSDKTEKNVNKDYILLLASAILFTSAKVTSIFLLPAVLLYGLDIRRKVTRKPRVVSKNIFWKISIVLLPLVITIIWMLFLSPEDTRMSDHNSLFTIFKPLYNTIFSDPSISDVFTWLIGNFAHIPIKIPIVFTIVGYIMMILYLIIGYDKEIWSVLSSGPVKKVIFFICLMGLIVTPIYAMWSTFTPVGMTTIIGIQGRYFYPALFAIGTLLGLSVIKTDEKLYSKLAIWGGVILNIMYWTIFINYQTGFILS